MGMEWGMPCCKETEQQVLKQASLGSHAGRWRTALKARSGLFAAWGVLVGRQAPATRQHRSSTWVAMRSASAGFSQSRFALPAECEGWQMAAENMPDNSMLGRRYCLFRRSYHCKKNTGFLPVRTHQGNVATVLHGTERKMLKMEKFNLHGLNGAKNFKKKTFISAPLADKVPVQPWISDCWKHWSYFSVPPSGWNRALWTSTGQHKNDSSWCKCCQSAGTRAGHAAAWHTKCWSFNASSLFLLQPAKRLWQQAYHGLGTFMARRISDYFFILQFPSLLDKILNFRPRGSIQSCINC